MRQIRTPLAGAAVRVPGELLRAFLSGHLVDAGRGATCLDTRRPRIAGLAASHREGLPFRRARVA